MEPNPRDMKIVFAEALVSIAEEKPLDKITVADVLGRTKAARQTFYNHFSCIDDLILVVVVLFFQDHHRRFYTKRGCADLYSFISGHRSFYEQLPRLVSQGRFRDQYIGWLRGNYYRISITDSCDQAEEARRKALIDAYLFGIVDCFLDWCKNGLNETGFAALIEAVYGLKPDFVPVEAPAPCDIRMSECRHCRTHCLSTYGLNQL